MNRPISRHLLTSGAAALWLAACSGAEQDPGVINAAPRPARVQQERALAQRAAAPDHAAGKHILFGDLHLHTSYSLDAFLTSLPLLGGEGSNPPSDACDFARHCAGLDFFAITDHARELTPAHWEATKQSIRQCDAVSGDPENPDLVAFHGFEWTQVGRTAKTHWGHKNVIFRGLSEEEVPARPISSAGEESIDPFFARAPAAAGARFIDPLHWKTYADFGWMFEQLGEVPVCDPERHTRDLPTGCEERAPTPDILFRKLDEWGFDSVVIPHGTAWGSYTPPTNSWDKQLTPQMHDPERQTLIEVMSGHGNAEPYRDYREFVVGEDGELSCPEPTPEYLPCCWQAGEIMRQRCDGLSHDECEARVAQAKQFTMEAGVAPDSVFPGTTSAEWLDCGQDRAGFKPAYGYRPRGSVQYALGLGDSSTAAGEEPVRFRFGFVASSDNHQARAATGFKPAGPKSRWTDVRGPRNALYQRILTAAPEPDDPQQPVRPEWQVGTALQLERISSFMYPGGAVAVHAAGRSREAIWQALERREVYGTSGPRILLWFDLLGTDGERLPMGSERITGSPPRFEVRAVGAFVQKPGCPQDVIRTLSPQRVASLCVGECYHPSDRRHRIDAIEVVRIRPRRTADEDLGLLIEDPWKRIACPGNAEGCQLQFEDPEFTGSGRDAIYYVRALQEPTLALNGATLRTRFDAAGAPISVRTCGAHATESPGDDCVAEAQERAWSSPIYLDYGGAGGS
jgi:hypothetical protein